MPLRFISHKEVTFRQLLSMLRTPPFAMMNYYSNLFMLAQLVMSGQPDKTAYLEKEIRRIECIVGVHRTEDSGRIQKELEVLKHRKRYLLIDREHLMFKFQRATEEEGKALEVDYGKLQSAIDAIDFEEHRLLLYLTPLMNLKMIETYADNNLDLKSFFKEGGKKVTQMELQAELDQAKKWIFMEVGQMMPHIRFTKLE